MEGVVVVVVVVEGVEVVEVVEVGDSRCLLEKRERSGVCCCHGCVCLLSVGSSPLLLSPPLSSSPFLTSSSPLLHLAQAPQSSPSFVRAGWSPNPDRRNVVPEHGKRLSRCGQLAAISMRLPHAVIGACGGLKPTRRRSCHAPFRSSPDPASSPCVLIDTTPSSAIDR